MASWVAVTATDSTSLSLLGNILNPQCRRRPSPLFWPLRPVGCLVLHDWVGRGCARPSNCEGPMSEGSSCSVSCPAGFVAAGEAFRCRRGRLYGRQHCVPSSNQLTFHQPHDAAASSLSQGATIPVHFSLNCPAGRERCFDRSLTADSKCTQWFRVGLFSDSTGQQLATVKESTAFCGQCGVVIQAQVTLPAWHCGAASIRVHIGDKRLPVEFGTRLTLNVLSNGCDECKASGPMSTPAPTAAPAPAGSTPAPTAAPDASAPATTTTTTAPTASPADNPNAQVCRGGDGNAAPKGYMDNAGVQDDPYPDYGSQQNGCKCNCGGSHTAYAWGNTGDVPPDCCCSPDDPTNGTVQSADSCPYRTSPPQDPDMVS